VGEGTGGAVGKVSPSPSPPAAQCQTPIVSSAGVSSGNTAPRQLQQSQPPPDTTFTHTIRRNMLGCGRHAGVAIIRTTDAAIASRRNVTPHRPFAAATPGRTANPPHRHHQWCVLQEHNRPNRHFNRPAPMSSATVVPRLVSSPLQPSGSKLAGQISSNRSTNRRHRWPEQRVGNIANSSTA
jgi:hypothetical protein